MCYGGEVFFNFACFGLVGAGEIGEQIVVLTQVCSNFGSGSLFEYGGADNASIKVR